MKFLVTFENYSRADFASAAEALSGDGFAVGDLHNASEWPEWVAEGFSAAVVTAPRRASGEAATVAGRIAKTAAWFAVSAEVYHLR